MHPILSDLLFLIIILTFKEKVSLNLDAQLLL